MLPMDKQLVKFQPINKQLMLTNNKHIQLAALLKDNKAMQVRKRDPSKNNDKMHRFNVLVEQQQQGFEQQVGGYAQNVQYQNVAQYGTTA